MRFRIIADESLPAPEALETSLKAGVATKRHEFIEKGSNDAFVVFEAEEDTPFWRRQGDGIRFVYTDLTYAKALAIASQPGSFLVHTVTDTDGEEFVRYYTEARTNHLEVA